MAAGGGGGGPRGGDGGGDGFSPRTVPPAAFLAGYLARIRFFDGDLPPSDGGGGGGSGGSGGSGGGRDGAVAGAVPPPTAATLARVHAAHLLALPFENLSIFCTPRMANDVDAAWAKMVARRRGGWCLEHNALLAGVCRALGYPRVTPRVGWVLPNPDAATLVALFGGGPPAAAGGGSDDRDVDGGGAPAAAPPTPPRHLVVEVEVAGVAGGGGVAPTPPRSYLLDAGNGRSFLTPLLLRVGGGGGGGGGGGSGGGGGGGQEGEAGDDGPPTGDGGGSGGVGEPVCQPDGVWWRVVPLAAVLTAAAVSPQTLRTLPGAVGDFWVVQWATPAAPSDGTPAAAAAGGDRPRGRGGGGISNGSGGGREGGGGVSAAPASPPAGGRAAAAVWNCFYVFDAARPVGALADLDSVRDYYQDDPGSLFRQRRLLTRPVDGGRRLVVMANGALRVGTSAGMAGGGGAAAAATAEVGPGGEAGWLATVADRFDVVLTDAEAARLRREAPLPPPETSTG